MKLFPTLLLLSLTSGTRAFTGTPTSLRRPHAEKSHHCTNNSWSRRFSASVADSWTSEEQNIESSTPTDLEKTVCDKVPSYPKLLLFAGTTILIWLSEPLLSLVDTTVVGWHSPLVQLASLGPATTLMDTLIYMTYFLALSTTSLISQGLATKDYASLQKRTSHLMGVAALMGLGVTGLVALWGQPLLASLAGSAASPELLAHALTYSRIRALVAPFSVLGMVAQSFSLATLDTVRPILAVVVASVVNVVGDMWLTPRLGVGGAAAATAAASLASSLVLLRGVWRKTREWRRLEHVEASSSRVLGDASVSATEDAPTEVPFLSLPDRKSFLNLLTLSGPLCFNMWAKMGCYSALTVCATGFGLHALAAHNILLRVFFFFGCFADSLGQTAQSFLPATLYPKFDRASFQSIQKRLGLLAIGTAVLIRQASLGLVSTAGKSLVQDAGVLSLLKGQAGWLGLSLMLHPLIVWTEGTVIATRDFRALIRTYAVTVVGHLCVLRYFTPTFEGVWRALFGFQLLRLINYQIWKKKKTA